MIELMLKNVASRVDPCDELMVPSEERERRGDVVRRPPGEAEHRLARDVEKISRRTHDRRGGRTPLECPKNQTGAGTARVPAPPAGREPVPSARSKNT